MTTKDILRDEYIKARRKTQKFYNGGDKLEQALDKAVNICTELEADPVLYVKAQYVNKKGLEFYHTCLHDKNCRDNYLRYLEQYKSITVEDEFNAESNMLRNFLKTGRSLEHILLDDDSHLSAWFRCIVTKEPIPEVMAIYGDKAKKELKNRELLSYLTGIKADVERIKNYAKLYSASE